MCGIAGLTHPRPSETPKLLMDLLSRIEHRGPDGAGVAVGSEIRTGWSLEELKVDGLSGTLGLGHVRLAIVGGIEGLQPFRSGDGKLVLLHNGEIYNHHELRRELQQRIDCETSTDSEVVLRMLEAEYAGDLAGAFRRVLSRLDGVYAFVVSDGESLIIARDPIGVRQLYLGRRGSTFAFASEKKSLLSIGIDEPLGRLEPGHMAEIVDGDWHQENFGRPDWRQVRTDIGDASLALATYERLLDASIHKRIRDRDRVGVVFSGGIDSVLIAHRLKHFKIPFACYTAGLKGSPDMEYARQVAAELQMPLVSTELSLDDVEGLLPEIVRTIEDRSLNQVEVSVPVFTSVRLAAEAGERVLFTGQGADELFGGYSWYPRIVEQDGYDAFVACEISDIEHLYKETLEREDKITMAHSIELRVPYLDLAIVEAALQMDPRLKIRDGHDRLGKWVHRRLAEHLGVPSHFAWRPKQAAQHGSGVHTAIQKLAERRGFTLSQVRAAGYTAAASIPEVLGSSSRYGYRYGEQDLWKTEDHVQYYLDRLASEAGLLDEVSYELDKLDTGLEFAELS